MLLDFFAYFGDNNVLGAYLSDNRYRQIAHVTIQVENGGKLQWNLVDLCDLPYSARVAELTNYDFLCLAWKIAIGLFSASALAVLKMSV